MFPLLLLVLVFHPLVLSLLKFVADVLIVDDAQQSECFTTVLRTVFIALLVADTMMMTKFSREFLSLCVVSSTTFDRQREKNVRSVVTTETTPNPSFSFAEERKKKRSFFFRQKREREFFFSDNTVVWSHNSVASFSSLSTLSAHTLRRRFNTLSVKREFREGEKEERFVYLLRTIRILTTHKNSVVGKECNPPPLPPRLG